MDLITKIIFSDVIVLIIMLFLFRMTDNRVFEKPILSSVVIALICIIIKIWS